MACAQFLAAVAVSGSNGQRGPDHHFFFEDSSAVEVGADIGCTNFTVSIGGSVSEMAKDKASQPEKPRKHIHEIPVTNGHAANDTRGAKTSKDEKSFLVQLKFVNFESKEL